MNHWEKAYWRLWYSIGNVIFLGLTFYFCGKETATFLVFVWLLAKLDFLEHQIESKRSDSKTTTV